MSAIETLQELINKHSNDELAKQHGMVYQVWHDGEITLQKAADLLWQRSLHTDAPGFCNIKLNVEWPHKMRSADNYYIFTDREGALAVRQAIRDAMKEHLDKTF